MAKQELKIRIHDYKKVEAKLTTLGAEFVKELDVVDSYFKQIPGDVLKMNESSVGGTMLIKLRLKDGKFEMLKQESVDDVQRLKTELTEEFGLKCVLKKKIRFFDFEDYEISLNMIEDVGEFLILEGENLSPEIITEKLGIEDPEFITVSFDELKRVS